jgi:hypothetical protein
MPSLLEIYKEKNSRQDKDNLEELTKLYNENRAYQSKYSFNEFVSVATKNSEQELDDSILEILNPPEEDEEDEIAERPKMTMMGGNVLTLLPKDFRRTIGGIGDMVGRGTTNALFDAANLLGKYSGQYEAAAKETGKSVQEISEELEKRQRQKTKEVFAPVGKAVFGEDIYDGVDIQDPESVTGSVVKPVGAFITSMFNLPKLATRGITKIDDFVGPFANKAAQKQAIKQATKNNRKKIAGQLARAEVASQVVFEDDPEFLMVAGGINSLLKEHNLDDSTLGAVVNWLDADENDTAAQRRLSLLLDGGVFTGGLYVTGKIIGAVGKGGYNAALKTIKNNPKAVEALKARLKPLLPSAGKVDDVFVEAEGSDLKTNAMNFFRGIRRKYGTSRGYKSEEMYQIINGSKAAKDAWELEAKNIFDTLSATMKKIAQEKKFTSKNLNDMLDNYLQGTADIKTLPKELQPIAEQAREQIKYLSKLMLENDSVPKELKNVIELNMGQYLRKTYELYENPNYKPSDEVKAKAVEYLTGVLADAPIQSRLFGEQAKRLTVPEAQQKAEEIVRDILKGGKGEKGITVDATDHLNKVFGANKAEIIFATRQDIDKPLRELMGEVTEDTSKSVFRTLTNLSQYLADTKLYDELYEAGAGKWFFDDVNVLPVGSGLKRTEGTIIGEGFGKLNGMRTTKQIADYFNAINNVPGQEWYGQVYKTFLTAKGFGQAFQTVYSVTTHARNTIGGGLIMASNGMNPFDRETANAFKILKNEIARSSLGKDKALQQQYLKYRRLGLVNQNVRAGEFNQLINEASDINWVQRADESFKSKAYNSTKKLIKDTHSKVQDVYVAEDDLWRIAAFQKELKTLQKAYPNRLIADLEREAADIIRNTMPTYDMVPEGAKALRKLPIGNFFSFTAERFRNNYHTLMQGRKEVLSGNDVLVERGLKRLSAKTVFGAAGAKGVNEFSKFAYGITQEEEDAIRNVSLAPWSKNSTLAFSRDEYGNIQYIDLSYTDPDAPVLDVFKAGLDALFDPDVPDAAISERLVKGLMIEPAVMLLKPFISEALLTTTLIEAYVGRDMDGRPIDGYNEENDALTNGMAIMNHIFYDRLTPVQLREAVDKIGDKDTDWAEYITSELTGQRFVTVNAEKIEKDLSFKMLDLKNGQRSAYAIFSKNIKDSDTTEELLNSYLDANRAYYRTSVRAKKAIDGAKFLNVSYDTIKSIVSDTVSGGRFNKAETTDLITGATNFSPLRVSKASLKQIYDQSDFVNINFQEFQNQYNLMYSKLSRLPLIEIKEIDDETQEALDMVKAPVRDIFRAPKAIGGLIKGKDNVPFTKENPADRIDPFTGKPYQDNREGFAIGGIINSVIKASSKTKKPKPIVKSNIEPEIETFNTYNDVGLNEKGVAELKDKLKKLVKQKEEDFGLPHRAKQDPEVIEAALSLSKNDISVDDYRKLILEKDQPKDWQFVPKPAAVEEIAAAITGTSNGVNKIDRGIINVNKSIPEGAEVGLRLDIPAYNNFDVWAVTVHKGKKSKVDRGKALGYGQTGWIKDVTFDAPVMAGFSIATARVPKTSVARMEGKWKNHTTEEAYTKAQELLTDKNWTQVGYNPFRVSYFYDRATMNPVIAADEVIQIGPFVIAKNIKTAKPTDKRFEIKTKEGNRFNFEKGGRVSTNEQMDRLGFERGGPVLPEYIGRDVYEKAIQKFAESEKDAQLLREFAWVESKFANDPTTFRKDNRSAYQITPIRFQDFKDSLNDKSETGAGLRRYIDKMEKKYNTNYRDIKYDDLNNPEIGTVVTRALLKRVPEPIGETPEQRAVQWKRDWNTELGAGTVEKYLTDLKYLD